MPWQSGRALVLGSGGAARAAIAAFARLGVREIVVRARAFGDAPRRDRFVDEAPAAIIPQSWRASASSEEQTIAVVQATSAGMKGADPGETVADSWRGDRFPLARSPSTSSMHLVTRHSCALRARGGFAATMVWGCSRSRARSHSSYGSAWLRRST